jgi:hypothetical protein
MREYEYDLIDGREVPSLVVHEEYVLTDEHEGTIYVESGRLKIVGILKGTLIAKQNTTVEIIGKQRGTVNVAKGCFVTVYGTIEGSTHLEQGSILVIEEGGILAGSLSNYGKVILRGIFGGASTGSGELRIEGNGLIKEPIVKNGINYYQW